MCIYHSAYNFQSIFFKVDPYSTLMLNQYFRNVELQHCKCCSNIAKYRFIIEKTSQKRSMSVECMSYKYFNSTLNQYLFNISYYISCGFQEYQVPELIFLQTKQNILKIHFIYFHLGSIRSLSRNYFITTWVKTLIMLRLLFYPEF